MCVVISGYRYYSPELGRWVTKDPINELGSMALRRETKKQIYELNPYGFNKNNPLTLYDSLGLCSGCDDCPSGEWTSFSIPSFSLFFGGGLTMAKTTYKCKDNKNSCKATAICFGGGAIAAVGIGIDFGGWPGCDDGVTGICNKNGFSDFSYGIYVTAGPVSETFTENSNNIGIAKSWGLGVAFITCTNTSITCNFD